MKLAMCYTGIVIASIIVLYNVFSIVMLLASLVGYQALDFFMWFGLITANTGSLIVMALIIKMCQRNIAKIYKNTTRKAGK